jgi:hypothetical protein
MSSLPVKNWRARTWDAQSIVSLLIYKVVVVVAAVAIVVTAKGEEEPVCTNRSYRSIKYRDPCNRVPYLP